MVEINHPDERVAEAFDARLEAGLYGNEWHDAQNANYFPSDSSHMSLNLQRTTYPAYHHLHPLQVWRVTMNGYGEIDGRKKSAAMRRLVREELNLNQAEFQWLMVRDGGTGGRFRHTWDIFTEDELYSVTHRPRNKW